MYGYPVEGIPYRQADEFSDDDDGPAIATKKEEMRNIEERYSRYHEQLCYPHKDPSQVVGLTEGIDCPFWSLDNKANHSRLFFGPLMDMHENVWHETARRILIVREFLLSFENRMIDQHFLEESDSRSEEIPRGEWTAQDITQAGWTLGEYRTVLRRLTRKLVEWALVDNFDRAQDSKNRDRDMPIPMQLNDFYMDFEADREEGDIYSDDEDFVEDVEKYIGLRKPIFDNCLAFIQKGMPNTLGDVFELVQDSKRQKVELRSTQEELDQVQQALKEAEEDLAAKEEEVAAFTPNQKFVEQSPAKRQRRIKYFGGAIETRGVSIQNQATRSRARKVNKWWRSWSGDDWSWITFSDGPSHFRRSACSPWSEGMERVGKTDGRDQGIFGSMAKRSHSTPIH